MTEQTNNNVPQLSFVMVVHDDETAIEQHLAQFLQQECATPYEVIVVDDASTDNTSDLLKSMKVRYPQLHITFFPKSVINPSRLQLALYVGIKAAKSDAIVLADINRPPTSPQWIDGLAAEMGNHLSEVVMVYSGHKHPEKVAFQSFSQLEEAEPLLRKSERRSGKGHQSNHLKLKRGNYDAVAFTRNRIYDAIRFYDCPVKGLSLLGLRLRVFFKNLID